MTPMDTHTPGSVPSTQLRTWSHALLAADSALLMPRICRSARAHQRSAAPRSLESAPAHAAPTRAQKLGSRPAPLCTCTKASQADA